MNIFFQTKKVEISSAEQDFMAHRIEGLKKFFSPQIHVYIDIEKTHGSHNGQDLFYVKIRIDDVHQRYFADEYQSDIRKAFDNTYADLYRIIRNERSRSRRLLTSAGRKFKSMFKKRYK